MAFSPRGFTTVLTLLALLSGCAGNHEKPSHIPSHETTGNPEVTQSLDCTEALHLKNTYTPPDLYRGMVNCVQEYDYYSAVYFFALAGTYTYYDTLRVADKTSYTAHKDLLQESLDTIGERKKNILWGELKDTLANPRKLPGFCRDIAHIGPPQYYPRYMILRGTGQLPDSVSEAGLIDDFDATAAWRKALRNYLHCTSIPETTGTGHATSANRQSISL